MYPQKGILAEGSDADIVIWDPNKKWTVKASEQVQNCDYTPYEGIEMIGKAEFVYLRGELIANDGRIVKENSGKYLYRGKSDYYEKD